MNPVRFIRSLVATCTLAGVVAGLPFLLLTFLGNPIPRKLPSLTWLMWWLRSGQFDDRTAVFILGYVLWGCWAVFTVQLAAQLPEALRAPFQVRHGGPAAVPRTRGLLTGGAAQILLTAMLVTLLAPRPAFAAARDAGTAGAASARPAAVAARTPGPVTRTTGVAAVSVHTHEVVAGDTLWDIAAEHLGDPERWPEIYAENAGAPQPGGRVLTNPEVILPGWRLVIPGAAAAEPVHTPVSVTLPETTSTPTDSPVVAESTTTPSQQTPAPATVAERTAPVREESRHVAPRDRVAVDLGANGYVGIGLASGVAAALAATRLRRRAHGRARFPIPLDSRHDERRPATLAE